MREPDPAGGRCIATNTWLAPAGAFRDTLWYNGSSYYRRLVDKTTIFYNEYGLQTRVVERDSQYDNNGNVVQDSLGLPGTHEFVEFSRYYDPAGRLGSTAPVSTASSLFFAYDALGRRVRGAFQGADAWIFYDGDNILRFRDHEFLPGPGIDEPLIAFFQTGTTCPSGSAEAYFVTAGNRLLDYQSSNTGAQCFHVSGSEVASWTGVGRHAGAIRDSHTFDLDRSKGAEESGAGALSFFRNRYYDATTGRFTQEDPIGFAGGLNLYAYAGNNPANYTDPFGLCPEPQNKNGTVCIALFIQSESVGPLKGDGRGFSSSSAASESRVWLHVNPADRSYSVHVNPTCTTGGRCEAPLADSPFQLTRKTRSLPGGRRSTRSSRSRRMGAEGLPRRGIETRSPRPRRTCGAMELRRRCSSGMRRAHSA